MIRQLQPLVLVALTAAANAAAVSLQPRNNSTLTSLPQYDSNPAARAAAVAVKKAGYLYGPSLIGNASFYPSGTLGNARVMSDLEIWFIDMNAQNASINIDLPEVAAAVVSAGGLNSLHDYATLLYNGEWADAIPGGEFPGMLTNYTQDLQFSMERLSLNPYPLRRLKASESLPFTLPASTAIEIAGLSVEALQAQGRLFVVDYSYQRLTLVFFLENYPTTGRFGAACTALFYIHPRNSNFLPLAIKTNVGSDLIYTPLDSPNDWLLAKILFNSNDLFYCEMFHLVATHDVGEIVYQAALRTLSEDHPIMALMDRLMLQAFAPRYVGEVTFSSGGPFDMAFTISEVGARQFVAEHYPVAGAYQANYLDTDFAAWRLIKSSGPAFSSFPFYEDMSSIQASIHAFMTSFVKSYYTSDKVMAADTELSAWFIEASSAAEVIDFPCPSGTTGENETKECSRDTLIDVLTHFAHLTGVAHHALNTGNLVASIGTLPFHPASLYAPIPTTKNVTDLMPFMPPLSAALFQFDLFAAFNRPQFEAEKKTLAWAFSDPTFLARFNSKVSAAASTFQNAMFKLSASIRARTFDRNGLWNGQPFIWRGVDPGTIPFFFAV